MNEIRPDVAHVYFTARDIFPKDYTILQRLVDAISAPSDPLVQKSMMRNRNNATPKIEICTRA